MEYYAATPAADEGRKSHSVTGRLVVYVLLGAFAASCASLLAGNNQIGSPLEYGLYRCGTTAWTAQVLLLVAVLTLAVPSRIVAFQLALLVALLQGYVHVGVHKLSHGSLDQVELDQHVSFAVFIGLSATLGAVLWLLVRIVFKRTLSAEAAENQGRSGQLGLQELLYVMASLSAVLAFVTLFAVPGPLPAERVLVGTLGTALYTFPLVYPPFWLAVRRPAPAAHWLWLVPLLLLLAWFLAQQETWPSRVYPLAAFLGIVVATAAVLATNALVLWLLGLHLGRGGNAQASGAR